MRAIAIGIVAALGGCLEVEQAHDYDVRVTYNGVRTEAVVAFPAYSHNRKHPASVDGTVVRGDAPIASLELFADDTVTFTFEIRRNADDADQNHSQIECTFDEADLGHATSCMFTRHSCSIVVEEMP